MGGFSYGGRPPMKNSAEPKDLAHLLAALDPAADLAHRHLWLVHLLDWVRG